REDGPGVEEMWEDKTREYPDLDTSLRHPMVGHNGIFEDYLDLAVRAVINPEIRCYLEKMEDNGIDLSDEKLGEALSNLSIIGLEDKEEDDNGNESSEEEEDGTDTTTLEIEEAISNFYFAGSVNKDDDGKETEGSEEDGDGSVTTTNGIIDAVANLRFTGLARNSVANEQFMEKETRDLRDSVARLNLDDTPTATLPHHLLSDEESEGEWHESFRHTIKEEELEGESEGEWHDSFRHTIKKEESDEKPDNSVGPAIKEEESDEKRIISRLLSYSDYPAGNTNPPSAAPRLIIPLIFIPTGAVSGFNNCLPENFNFPSGGMTNVAHVEHRPLCPSHQSESGNTDYMPAQRLPGSGGGFLEEDIHKLKEALLKDSREARAIACENWVAARSSQADNTASGYQGQPAGHNAAPYFAAHCCIHSTAHIFQRISSSHNPTPAFGVVSYSTPILQIQPAVHSRACFLSGTPFRVEVCAFYDHSKDHNLVFPSEAVNYPTPHGTPMLQGNPFVSNHASNVISQAASYSAPVPQVKPVTYIYPPQFNYTFCNLTQDGITARKIIKKAVKRYSNSLAVQKQRSSSGTKIKTEEDGEVKMETIRRHSDSVLERKRARDMDEEAEDASERPRKFSG
ncbi:hypothetical protein V495_08200, partial [Pseudogymnoascus sp. VKM F-4514 (FW-929)]